ncbi:MAG: hypothetical protein EAZ91_19775 [Cytophagales bacterium]|nr:MAG: hypothetical protein EAZ91_19775 [Cytophagales bacterium]
MATEFNRTSFFVSPPDNLAEAFQRHWLLTVLVRMRWMFYVGLVLHVIFFSLDWVRYQEGTLLTNTSHRGLFYSHFVSFSLNLMYWWATTHRKAVWEGQSTEVQRIVLGIFIFFSLYGIPRAAFAYVDRQTLVFFTYYLVVTQVLFLIGHRGRIITAAVAILVLLAVTYQYTDGLLSQRYSVMVEVVVFGGAIFGLGTYFYNVFVREFVQRRLIEAQNEQIRQQAEQLEKDRQQAVQELEQRSQELISYILQEQQRNTFLVELKQKIKQPDATDTTRIAQLIDSQLSQEDRWQHFVLLFERVHPQFFGRIQAMYPSLSSHDLRVMALLKMNLSTKEIAGLLGISPQSANTARYRLRKRLQLDAEDSLEAFLQLN